MFPNVPAVFSTKKRHPVSSIAGHRLAIILGLAMATGGCAFAPTIASEQPYASKCKMSTKMLTLDSPKATAAVGCQKQMRGDQLVSCLIVAGVIIPAGSFIISGSIVLVNNTLHWLEYQGGCDPKVDKDAKPPTSQSKERH